MHPAGAVFTLRETGGEPGAIIEDELRGRFYRVGMVEYTFHSLLAVRTTIEEALGATALQLKDRALTDDRAAVGSGDQLDATSARLALGEMGIVRLPIRSGSLWEYVTQKLDREESVRWTTTHGESRNVAVKVTQ